MVILKIRDSNNFALKLFRKIQNSWCFIFLLYFVAFYEINIFFISSLNSLDNTINMSLVKVKMVILLLPPSIFPHLILALLRPSPPLANLLFHLIIFFYFLISLPLSPPKTNTPNQTWHYPLPLLFFFCSLLSFSDTPFFFSQCLLTFLRYLSSPSPPSSPCSNLPFSYYSLLFPFLQTVTGVKSI